MTSPAAAHGHRRDLRVHRAAVGRHRRGRRLGAGSGRPGRRGARGRRPQPGPARTRPSGVRRPGAGVAQRPAPGPVRSPQHGRGRGDRRRGGLPRRRRRGPSGLAGRAARAVRATPRSSRSVGWRTRGSRATARACSRPAVRAATRPVSWTGSSGAPTPGSPRSGRGPQPDGLQHVGCAGRCSPRWVASPRTSAASGATRWAARRPSSASGSGRRTGATAGRRGSCSNPAPRSTTG